MSPPLRAPHRGGDIPKLRVPIGMLTAFPRLDVALEGVAQLVQQLGNDGVADRMPQGLQRDRQRPGTLAGPSQRRIRIAGGRGLNQGIEITQQRRIENGGRFPTAPWSAVSSRRQGRVSLEFAQAALDRRPRNAGRPFDYADATVPQCARFARGPQPTRALGEHRRQRGMFCAERGQAHASRYQPPCGRTSDINQLFPDRS